MGEKRSSLHIEQQDFGSYRIVEPQRARLLYR